VAQGWVLPSTERKLEFKVSAKAARLIGRENVANAEGAIVELVKNTYDADADKCLVVFNQRFEHLPQRVDQVDYQWLCTWVDAAALYEQTARPSDGEKYYILRPGVDAKIFQIADEIVGKALDLWVIDNGNGMSAEAIEKYWMVIGTNFKELNVYSDRGRVRTGAKGIGRFALDRLGRTCNLFSTQGVDATKASIRWTVDWEAFEGPGKVLDQVRASLYVFDDALQYALQSIKASPDFLQVMKNMQLGRPWDTGTAICITALRDEWDEGDVQHLFKSLSSLIPPKEQPPLRIFLLDARRHGRWGEVLSDAPTDYDYRLHADVHGDGNVDIDIHRNELRIQSLAPALFARKDMAQPRFQKESFEAPIRYSTSLSDLMPGDDQSVLNSIGPFKFTLLFYKRSLPNKEERDRYPYRSFDAQPRVKWLNEQGGIKIYRDDFIVRPYGEPDGKGFDWLRLGQRGSQNPAAASRKGAWRVNPQNVTGTLEISRATNPNLIDQSNREGLIENGAFRALNELTKRLIKEFEDDRSHILHNLNELFRESHPADSDKAKAENLAAGMAKATVPVPAQEAAAVARAYRARGEEIRELTDELAMLRSLATLGTVLVSFSHEMAQLQSSLGNRMSTLARILKKYAAEQINLIPEGLDPIRLLKDAEETDRKIRQWFNFSLTAVKASKRARRVIRLRDHMNGVKSSWLEFLDSRQIELDIEFDRGFDPRIRALEIDLDSVFNNLILNSVEAFVLKNHAGERKINITFSDEDEKYIDISYADSGPGLSKIYKNPDKIFDFSETTKKSAAAGGTGIGMWILDSVIKSYGGTAQVLRLSDKPGFHMLIRLPTKAQANA
jgi:signal transduction histidine kinase